MSEKVFPPIKLAFVLDGKVVDIVHTVDRLAAIFLSNPIVVEIDDDALRPGDSYDEATGVFTPAVVEADTI